MAIGLFILAIIIQLAMVLAIFLLSLSRVTGSIVALVTVLVTTFISPWSLILGIPIALLCIVLLVAPIRQSLIARPVYKTLGGAMPSMSDTEREALDAGTAGGKKSCLWAIPTGTLLLNIPIQSCRQKSKALLIMK